MPGELAAATKWRRSGDTQQWLGQPPRWKIKGRATAA
jgi:hypothetical protein